MRLISISSPTARMVVTEEGNNKINENRGDKKKKKKHTKAIK